MLKMEFRKRRSLMERHRDNELMILTPRELDFRNMMDKGEREMERDFGMSKSRI